MPDNTEDNENKEDGIVKVWNSLTEKLSHLSPIELMYTVCGNMLNKDSKNNNSNKDNGEEGNNKYRFIEKCVVMHTILAFIISIAMCYFFKSTYKIPMYIILFYGSLRIFDIIVKQIRVILFDSMKKNESDATKENKEEIKNDIINNDKRKSDAEEKYEGHVKSVRRSIILLMHNIIEMVFWFSVLLMGTILLNKESIENMINGTFDKLCDVYSYGDFVSHSALLMSVYSDDYTPLQEIIKPHTWQSRISIIEIITGFIMIVIFMAQFLSAIQIRESIKKSS